LDLSIIIVNWHSKEYLRDCLASLFEPPNGIEFEVVVIDSGSFDGCSEMLKQQSSRVNFIQAKDNLGFAKANNEAFQITKGRNILFLNPDTEIESDAVWTLFDALERLPNAGIVGARLLNTDRTAQMSCVRVFPTILNQVLESEWMIRLFPRSRLWRAAALSSGNEPPVEVDAVSGACLMIKRSVFEAVDMFSTDYFMYSEDIDLCYKVRKAGLKTYYVSKAVVVHHGGGSSSKSKISAFSSVMMLESRNRFFKKNRSAAYGSLYRLAMFLTSLFRLLIIVSSWPLAHLIGKPGVLEAPFAKWTARLRWTLGLEKWVKNY